MVVAGPVVILVTKPVALAWPLVPLLFGAGAVAAAASRSGDEGEDENQTKKNK